MPTIEERKARVMAALAKDFLLGDGANGTLLAAKGYKESPDLANLERPDLVLEGHREYVQAGADYLKTNTFLCNRIRLAGRGYDVADLNLRGARLAREAAGEKLVFGSIGPCGKQLEPIGHITESELAEAYSEQAKALEAGGVDGYLLESFIDLKELRIAVNAIKEANELPMIVCKAFIEDGEALAEGLPMRCAADMAEMHVVAVGANCVVGPQRMLDIIRQIAEITELPVVALPTPGLPQLVRGQVTYDISPEYFAKATARLLEEGARVVGGCCGTTPEHIRQMRALFDSAPIKRSARRSVTTKEKATKPLPESEPTELAIKLKKGKFIVTVEMDLPRGLNVDKVVAGSRSLKIHGADLIDISDGARARLRMNPGAISALIQQQVGIEVMMHFACRDRNLLAVQADLLGLHTLGVRNILAITGDPANIGDYPSATSVFDIDSIGLVRVLSRFNEGLDMAGYTIGRKCAFTIAVAFNPLAGDLDAEVDRLKRKADAGAHVVYTQPIFERAYIERTLEVCGKLGLPAFIGLLPLRNTRHAEFMHNEVPGIEVPDWLRAMMAGAPDDETALEIGIGEARKLASEVRQKAQGLYLMPPFGKHEIAEAVMEALT